jgi:uncharacterized C2H2 Zn-finger protein
MLNQLGTMNNHLECLTQYQKQSVVEVLHSTSEEMEKVPELLEVQHLNEHFQSIIFQLKNVLEMLSENANAGCFLPKNDDTIKFIDARISICLQSQLKEAMSEVEHFMENTRSINENDMTFLIERIQEVNRNMLESLIRKLPRQNDDDPDLGFYMNRGDDEKEEEPPNGHEKDNDDSDNHPDERENDIHKNDHGEEEDDPDPPGNSNNGDLTVGKIIDALLEAKDDVGLEKLLKRIGVRFLKPNRGKIPELIGSNEEVIQWMINVSFFPPVSNCVCLEKSCLKKFKSKRELLRHIRKDHDNSRLNMPMSLFEQIIGFEFKWGWKPFLQHANSTLLTEENPKCKIIGKGRGKHLMKCPFPKCRRLFLDQAQMNNHISKDHMKVIPSGWKKVNSFWLILRRFVEMSRFYPSMKFIISDVDAFKCDECDFISTSPPKCKSS